MDGAYDRWQQHEKRVEDDYKAERIDIDTARKRKWDFADMLDHACNTRVERAACMLGKLNQQIGNGGWEQWVDNGYALDSMAAGLDEHLREMGPKSQRVLEMVLDILSYYDDDGTFTGDDFEWEQFVDGAADSLSTEFYALDDEWHVEVYAYLELLG
jgi:hypothetical protein